MKQFKTLVIAVALILGATSFTNAQSKVAHIASQELIEQMPAYKEAMNQLEKLQKTYDTEIKDMVAEAQATMQRYEAEAQSKTDEENAKRATELQQTQRTIGEYRQNAMQELQKKPELPFRRWPGQRASTTSWIPQREQVLSWLTDTT